MVLYTRLNSKKSMEVSNSSSSNSNSSSSSNSNITCRGKDDSSNEKWEYENIKKYRIIEKRKIK